MKQLSACALFFALSTQQGLAQWIHQEQGSAFDVDRTQIALTALGQYALGLRCTDDTDLTVIFVTPEAVNSDAIGMINLASPELLLRVDQNEPLAIAAEGDIPNGELTIHADAPVALLTQLIEASSGVSVAARMLGTLYHETEFNVRGSTAAITTLSEQCGLELE